MASAHTPATLASAAIVPGWFFQTKKKADLKVCRYWGREKIFSRQYKFSKSSPDGHGQSLNG
jgi:hypothetical protein